MSKLIQIIFAKNPQELTDRKSVLGAVLFTLSESLVAKGFRVRLNEMDFDEARSKIKKPEAFANHITRRRLPLPKYLKAFWRDRMLFSSYEKLVEKLSTLEKADVILELYSFGSDVGLKLSKNWSIPLHIIYDAPIMDEYNIFQGFDPPMKGKVRKAELETLRRAEGIVAYSEPMKQYVTDLASLENNSHVKISQIIDFSRFDFGNGPEQETPIVIGFVGSFLKWHRLDMLVRIFEKLRKDGFEHTKLLLVGSGLEFPAIKKQVEESPYREDIEMPGFQDGASLLALKKRMHIGVMGSSNWYGAPHKLFEYGAMSMACVAPRTPTISDIFDESLLLMFDNHDEEGLYRVLKTYLENPELIAEKGNKFQQFIKSKYGREKDLNFYANLMNLEIPRKVEN